MRGLTSIRPSVRARAMPEAHTSAASRLRNVTTHLRSVVALRWMRDLGEGARMALGGLGNTTAMMLLDLRRGTPALRTVTPGIWSLLRVVGLVAGVPGQLWGRARRAWP